MNAKKINLINPTLYLIPSVKYFELHARACSYYQ